MSSSTSEVKGFSELMEKFDQLEKNLDSRILYAACGKAMEPVLDEAKRLVPRDTGMLHDGIAIRFGKKKGSGAAAGEAGLKVFGPHKFIWHLVEFGVPSRGIGARPFLRPALRNMQQKSIEILRTHLREAIDRAIKKQDAIPPEIRAAKLMKQAISAQRKALKSALWKLEKARFRRENAGRTKPTTTRGRGGRR